MDYEETLSKVIRELRGYCAKEIYMNYEDCRHFKMWVECDGGIEIAGEYVRLFKKYFGERINDTIEDRIFVAGKSIEYLMGSLYDSDTDIDDMVRIVNSFMTLQLNDMSNWCDDLSSSFAEIETD